MDIQKIMKELTLEEKASLLSGKNLWWFNGLPRFNIRDFMVSDGPHGVRVYLDPYENNGYPHKRASSTAFPSASCMASTWNESLLHEVGETIGKECNHYKVDVVLGPGVDGKRSPLGGRNFEYYSEDPILSGKMGTAWVKGVQSQGVGTSVKHFILNEQESSRRFISSEVDDVTFHELYAKPFEMIIKEGKPLTVMAAYNQVKGIYSCENPDILKKLLRDDWGFEGLAISDWGGVQNKRASVLGGLDIEMPSSEFVKPFIEDVKQGKYPIEVIDQAVERILKAYQWMLVNPHYGQPTDFEKNHLVAQKVAEEGIVLLKNNQGFLPLDASKKIVVLGTYAEHPRTHGGGSSELKAYITEIPLIEIQNFADVTYFADYQLTDVSKKAISKADAIILFTGTTTELEHEGDDRINLSLPEEQVTFIQAVSALNTKIVIVNNSGSAIEVQPFINHVQAFLQSWFLGSASGAAIAKILFGIINPSGKLSETFPVCIENTPTYPIFPGKGSKAVYSEGLFTGYRFFDTHKIPVSFPFGYGLSYSTFSYENLTINKTHMTNGEIIKLTIDVKNLSTRIGKESLQLYIKPLQSSLSRPNKTLKGFVKKKLDPDETKTFSWSLSDSDFAVYIPEKERFMVEKGHYEIQIGTSINDIVAKTVVEFDSKDDITPYLSIKAPTRQWLESPLNKARIWPLLSQFRVLHFYENEEPLERIIKRVMREQGIDEVKIEQALQQVQTLTK